ncbi:MAG: hypothetical protein IRY90_07765, partial [Actinomadura rubrobrunea]|nr:hypothetical protein [Actinomadura rubrobrunea]
GARHRRVAGEGVADPALAGTVLWARTDGFEQGGRVVRKAEVCVAKAPEPAPEPAPAPDPAAGTEPDAAADPTSRQSHRREAGAGETMATTSTASSTPPSASRARRATASGAPGPGSDR